LPEDVDLQQIKELVRLVEKNKLAELTVEENGVTITVKGAVPTVEPMPQQVYAQLPVHEEFEEHEPLTEALAVEPESENLVTIGSPMVGVFYRTPSPDSPPFIDVGDVIEVGHTIGLIEAMKVFSEIPSEVAGEVVEIVCDNGKLVQQGQPLVIIRPS
jgi:acetyl-CoA carboxylase biotin carboxyl carrier protein